MEQVEVDAAALALCCSGLEEINSAGDRESNKIASVHTFEAVTASGLACGFK